jgi:Squalene/phytoene synthase
MQRSLSPLVSSFILPPLAQSVRSNSRALFLLAMSLPKKMQAPALAVLGFYCEIAAIPAKVREPLLGHIRVQWWRDALCARSTAHPVLQALQAAGVDHAPLMEALDAVDDVLNNAISDTILLAERTLGVLYAGLAAHSGAPAAQHTVFQQMGAALQLYPLLTRGDPAIRSYIENAVQTDMLKTNDAWVKLLNAQVILRAALKNPALMPSHHAIPFRLLLRLLILALRR